MVFKVILETLCFVMYKLDVDQDIFQDHVYISFFPSFNSNCQVVTGKMIIIDWINDNIFIIDIHSSFLQNFSGISLVIS